MLCSHWSSIGGGRSLSPASVGIDDTKHLIKISPFSFFLFSSTNFFLLLYAFDSKLLLHHKGRGHMWVHWWFWIVALLFHHRYKAIWIYLISVPLIISHKTHSEWHMTPIGLWECSYFPSRNHIFPSASNRALIIINISCRFCGNWHTEQIWTVRGTQRLTCTYCCSHNGWYCQVRRIKCVKKLIIIQISKHTT